MSWNSTTQRLHLLAKDGQTSFRCGALAVFTHVSRALSLCNDGLLGLQGIIQQQELPDNLQIPSRNGPRTKEPPRLWSLNRLRCPG